MSDLEKLIRARQDALRGRPRDWRDDLTDWNARQDWEGNVIAAFLVLGFALAWLPVIAIGLLFIFE